MAREEKERDAVQVVVQRCNSASLVLDEQERVGTVGRGLVVYLSLGQDTTSASVKKAAWSVVQVPLLTLGEWGDGSKPQSLVRLLTDKGARPGLMIIPQASLTCTIKGKSLKYSKQLDKKDSALLYCEFLAEIEHVVFLAALENMFKSEDLFTKLSSLCDFDTGEWLGECSAFDKRGVPTHRSEQEPLSKADRKRVDKIYKYLHGLAIEALPLLMQRHLASQRLLSRCREDLPLPPVNEVTQNNPAVTRLLQLSLIDFVSGTFGNRQGLRFTAELGPSTHVFSF